VVRCYGEELLAMGAVKVLCCGCMGAEFSWLGPSEDASLKIICNKPEASLHVSLLLSSLLGSIRM